MSAELADILYQQAERNYYGDGVERNYPQAMTLYAEASELGHPAAMYAIALMLYRGCGCKADPARANEFLDKAIALEHPGAMISRAWNWQYGRGCPKSDINAARLCRRAVELNEPDAIPVLQHTKQPIYQYHYFMSQGDYAKASNIVLESPDVMKEFHDFDLERALQNPDAFSRHIEGVTVELDKRLSDVSSIDKISSNRNIFFSSFGQQQVTQITQPGQVIRL